MSLFDLWWYATAALVGHTLGASARRFFEHRKVIRFFRGFKSEALGSETGTSPVRRPTRLPAPPQIPLSCGHELDDYAHKTRCYLPAPPKPTRGYE